MKHLLVSLLIIKAQFVHEQVKDENVRIPGQFSLRGNQINQVVSNIFAAGDVQLGKWLLAPFFNTPCKKGCTITATSELNGNESVALVLRSIIAFAASRELMVMWLLTLLLQAQSSCWYAAGLLTHAQCWKLVLYSKVMSQIKKIIFLLFFNRNQSVSYKWNNSLINK